MMTLKMVCQGLLSGSYPTGKRWYAVAFESDITLVQWKSV